MKKKRYSSYKGEISPEMPNLLNQDFHADRPGKKMIIFWSIGTNPSAELANTMLANGIANLRDSCNAIIHSDRDCHYRWPGWIELMERHNLTRWMSKKGYSSDNSAWDGASKD